MNINQFNGWKADCSKSGCCLSVCLPVSLSLHDCAPSDTLGVLLFYHLLYFLSRQLSGRRHGYYLEIQHVPPPQPSLTYTAGSSPYSGNRCIDQLRCCVTDGCTGIRWSICIIGIWALFISFPYMFSHQYVQLRWLYFHMWTHFHIEAAGPDNNAFEHGLCVGIPKFRIIYCINCPFRFKCKALNTAWEKAWRKSGEFISDCLLKI